MSDLLGQRGVSVCSVSRRDVEQLAVRKMGKGTAASRFRSLEHAELPSDIKDAAASQGIEPGAVRAVHWRGSTCRVGSCFGSAREIDAAFHEHYFDLGLPAKYDENLRMGLGKRSEAQAMPVCREAGHRFVR